MPRSTKPSVHAPEKRRPAIPDFGWSGSMIYRSLARRDSLCAVGVALLLIAGCGKSGTPKYPISGKVSFDGKPVATGDLQFIPADPKLGPTAGKINDGQFHFDSFAGPQRVEIRALRQVPGAAPILGEYPQENILPAKYHAQSELTANVTPEGPNEFVFELSPAKR